MLEIINTGKVKFTQAKGSLPDFEHGKEYNFLELKSNANVKSFRVYPYSESAYYEQLGVRDFYKHFEEVECDGTE